MDILAHTLKPRVHLAASFEARAGPTLPYICWIRSILTGCVGSFLDHTAPPEGCSRLVTESHPKVIVSQLLFAWLFCLPDAGWHDVVINSSMRQHLDPISFTMPMNALRPFGSSSRWGGGTSGLTVSQLLHRVVHSAC